MRTADLILLAFSAVRAGRSRTRLTLLSIAIGVATVVILTAMGAGLQRFILGEFTQFGTHLIAITPGKTSTFGLSGAIINNVRPLSLLDAQSLQQIRGVKAVVPLVQGNADIEYGHLARRSMVFGVGPAVPQVWQITPRIGQFLPADDLQHPRPYAVIGHRVWQELFNGDNPLGQRIRISGETFRIIGVMEAKGQLLGFDLDDTVYLPVGKAMSLFNQNSLMEIDLLYDVDTDSEHLARRLSQHLLQRHGSEDFTIVTQDQMLSSLGSVMGIVTLAVAALGGLSLLVGAIGIATIMTIAVNERRAEIGLLSALGGNRSTILRMFLLEAVFLSGSGGLLGLLCGALTALLINIFVPGLPVQLSPLYMVSALAVAVAVGLISGIAPARQAATINPVTALHEE